VRDEDQIPRGAAVGSGSRCEPDIASGNQQLLEPAGVRQMRCKLNPGPLHEHREAVEALREQRVRQVWREAYPRRVVVKFGDEPLRP